MPAYIIADVEVTDPAQYEEYKKLSTAAMQAHRAEVLVRGGRAEPLEGREPRRVIVLKFPSLPIMALHTYSDTLQNTKLCISVS